MLRLMIFNVGHGDSIVLEHIHAGRSYYGVIDSNVPRGQATPRALDYLKNRGVEHLSFIALTHPHKDHVSGLGTIAKHFEGHIELALTYPIPRDEARLTRLKQLTAEEMRAAEEPQRSFLSQLLRFLLVAQGTPRWEATDGLQNEVFLNGFTFGEMTLRIILPHASMKDWFFSDLSNNKIEIGGEKQNELSLAIEIVYGDQVIVLGGDAAERGWLYRAKHAPHSVGATIAKLPHHGSKFDCSPSVLNHIYGVEEEISQTRLALISANGTSHPSPSVLSDLKSRGISPFCTSRATVCNGTSVTRLITDSNLDPELVRSINAYASNSSVEGACQGDIVVEITAHAGISVSPQYNTPCGFRHNGALEL